MSNFNFRLLMASNAEAFQGFLGIVQHPLERCCHAFSERQVVQDEWRGGCPIIGVRLHAIPTDVWMSQTDIRKNIEEFGPQQGLLDAQEAYRKNVEINP